MHISELCFDWIAECRNTVKQIARSFDVPRAIAKEIQGMVARGATHRDCEAVAAASWELRSQIGN